MDEYHQFTADCEELVRDDKRMHGAFAQLQAAAEAVMGLRAAELDEIRQMATPAPIVRKVMEATCILCGDSLKYRNGQLQDDFWVHVGRMCLSGTFLQNLSALASHTPPSTPAQVPSADPFVAL